MIETGIAELKARLFEYLREVRAGRTIMVLDRDTPVAQITPVSGTRGSITVRHPRRGAPTLQQIKPPRIRRISGEIVALLEAERQGNR